MNPIYAVSFPSCFATKQTQGEMGSDNTHMHKPTLLANTNSSSYPPPIPSFFCGSINTQTEKWRDNAHTRTQLTHQPTLLFSFYHLPSSSATTHAEVVRRGNAHAHAHAHPPRHGATDSSSRHGQIVSDTAQPGREPPFTSHTSGHKPQPVSHVRSPWPII